MEIVIITYQLHIYCCNHPQALLAWGCHLRSNAGKLPLVCGLSALSRTGLSPALVEESTMSAGKTLVGGDSLPKIGCVAAESVIQLHRLTQNLSLKRCVFHFSQYANSSSSPARLRPTFQEKQSPPNDDL